MGRAGPFVRRVRLRVKAVGARVKNVAARSIHGGVGTTAHFLAVLVIALNDNTKRAG